MCCTRCRNVFKWVTCSIQSYHYSLSFGRIFIMSSFMSTVRSRSPKRNDSLFECPNCAVFDFCANTALPQVDRMGEEKPQDIGWLLCIWYDVTLFIYIFTSESCFSALNVCLCAKRSNWLSINRTDTHATMCQSTCIHENKIPSCNVVNLAKFNIF